MKVKALSYLFSYVLLPLAFFSFTGSGWVAWLPIIYGFGLIPLFELWFKPSALNLTEVESNTANSELFFDIVIYLSVPVVLALSLVFLFNLNQTELFSSSWWGRVFSMGFIYGVLGINVAHELGHRLTSYEAIFAKILLAMSQYMHFTIEHNRGHHKNVGTRKDPATSRINEWLPVFWVRSIVMGYLSAWNLENHRLKLESGRLKVFKNEMIHNSLIQIMVFFGVYEFFGGKVMVGYGVSALIGILLLETVNYIEHYGLVRNKVSRTSYERTTPVHSWNSNHPIGRLTLFELSRHSDHHSRPNRKYQVLRHHENSPQMPTGYPGMMLLSLLPPLWFAIMNPRVKRYQNGLSS